MKNKKIAALLGILLAGSMAFSLSACGNSNDSAASDKSSASASASKADDSSKDDSSDSAGFEEIQVDEKHSDQECGPLTVNAVYFQPIDMEPSGMGLKAADASFHLEADIHANQKGTELGYGKGDFVPDLTVDYDIIDKTSNASVASGTFMQMNASDGPHYGANVKLDKAGAYKLVLKIESPEKKGWMLHVDPETGVKGRFWTEPIEVTFPDWNYTPQEWWSPSVARSRFRYALPDTLKAVRPSLRSGNAYRNRSLAFRGMDSPLRLWRGSGKSSHFRGGMRGVGLFGMGRNGNRWAL